MRSAMGSWPFVFGFFGAMIVWSVLNTYLLPDVFHVKAFDPYPYILLNLFLSMLAGVQAAALLIAAKREDSISSEIAVHTERNTDDIKILIQENVNLTAQVKIATDLLDEIHRHVAGTSDPRKDARSRASQDLGVTGELEPTAGAAPGSEGGHK